MSYKVLIVDDDSIVRIGLKSVVDWQKLDLEIIGEASDGVEAYELISRLRPDIVLTDMHMPRSDGVRLMEQAKRDFPDTLFLVLSCYNDLEYVKESMKLGAFDYLLKDEIVNTDKLTRILQNAISALEASRGRKLAAFFPSQEYLPSCVLRKRFLADLLEGKVQDPHMIAAASEELQLRFDENPPFFVILELDDYVGVLRRFVDTDALDYAVKKLYCEILKEYGHTEFFVAAPNVFCALVEVSARSNIITPTQRILSILERVRMLFHKEFRSSCTIYADRIHSFAELTQSYQHINHVMCFEMGKGDRDQIFCMWERPIQAEPEDLKEQEPPHNAQQDPIESVCDYINAHYAENITLDSLAQHTNYSKYYICKLFRKKVGINITDYIADVRIAQAKKMLLEGNIKIGEIAEKVGFNNPSYFHKIFKKTVGATPKEYMRMHPRS